MTTTRTALAALAATIVMALAPSPADAAQAPRPDTRPCVSKAEFFGSDFEARPVIEALWEVTGRAGWDPVLAAWAYPRCGFKFSESWYALAWDWDKGLMYRYIVRLPGAKPTGAPL